MISIKSVSKTFRIDEKPFNALNQVSLEIKKGEYLAIVGKSGSGKSTLLNLISGIDRPSEGEIWLNGKNTTAMNEGELSKWRGQSIGIVFQFFQLIPTLTVLENMVLAMDFVNTIPKKERTQRALNLLSQVEILDQANKFPATLSGGQQQRAAIARALSNNPEIIIADEPTGNLDSKTADSINDLLSKLSNEGKTIIVVTHEKEIAARFNRIITLVDGEVVTDISKN